MGRSPSRSSDGGGPIRVEPLLIKAIEGKKPVDVIAIIEEAKAKGQPIDHLLRIGLMRAVERENVNITEYLLGAGARPDGAPGGRASPVLKAAERNNHVLLQVLLRFGGDVDAQDKQGRTALMTAAWKNKFHAGGIHFWSCKFVGSLYILKVLVGSWGKVSIHLKTSLQVK